MFNEVEKLSTSDLMTQEATEEANRNYRESVNAMINAVETDLSKIEDLTPRIHDVMFREVFLPFFANDEDRKYPQVTLDMWIESIAGNRFQKVYIVNDKGEVVATVPPVLDRDVIRPKDVRPEDITPDHRSVEDIFKTTQMLGQRSPKVAENLFLQNMDGRMEVTGKRKRRLMHAHQWNVIYEYFGREKPFKGVEEALEKISKAESGVVEPIETEKVNKDNQSGNLGNIEYELA